MTAKKVAARTNTRAIVTNNDGSMYGVSDCTRVSFRVQRSIS